MATFAIVGEARPDTLSRVIGLIAQLGLVPLHVSMGRIGDMVLLAIAQDAIEHHRAEILAGKIRALVSIANSELHFHRHQEPFP